MFTYQNKQYVGIDVHVGEPIWVSLPQTTEEEGSLIKVCKGWEKIIFEGPLHWARCY